MGFFSGKGNSDRGLSLGGFKGRASVFTFSRKASIISVLRTPGHVSDRFSDPSFHAQNDWTTGVLDNGNEWRKFRAVPRSYSLRSLVLYFVSKG